MKKSISVSNLTLDLYLTYVRPAAIAAGILEEVPARDDWHEYTALHTDAAAADEIAHCMYCACMCAGNDGIERTHEEYIRHEAERMIGQLEVSIKYDLHNVADTLTALLAAMTEALHPTTPAEAAQAATEPPEQPTTDEQKEEVNPMSNTANDLQKYVDGIAADLRRLYEAEPTDEEREAAEENGEACDLYTYFEDVLDIEYTISSRGDYLGARVAVALGGPNIYIDTREGYVKGYWGTDRAERWIPSEICEEIDGIMEEYYDMVRGA